MNGAPPVGFAFNVTDAPAQIGVDGVAVALAITGVTVIVTGSEFVVQPVVGFVAVAVYVVVLVGDTDVDPVVPAEILPGFQVQVKLAVLFTPTCPPIRIFGLTEYVNTWLVISGQAVAAEVAALVCVLMTDTYAVLSAGAVQDIVDELPALPKQISITTFDVPFQKNGVFKVSVLLVLATCGCDAAK